MLLPDFLPDIVQIWTRYGDVLTLIPVEDISRPSLVQLNRLPTDFSDKNSAELMVPSPASAWGDNSFFRCFPLRRWVWGNNLLWSPLRQVREVVIPFSRCFPLRRWVWGDSLMVPSPTVCEVTIPFPMIPSPTASEVIPFQIIKVYGSRSDTAKMVIPAKIFLNERCWS